MRVLIYLATWQRIEITKICYKNLHRFIAANPCVSFQVMVVCSESEHIDLAKQNGFNCCLTENLPLGTKLNYGLQQAMDMQWDYVMQIGSDDVLNPQLMQHYLPYMQHGHHIIGVTSCIYLDMASKQAKEFVYTDPGKVIGAGRLISRQAIEVAAVCYTIITSCQMSDGDIKIYRNQQYQMPSIKALSLINSGHAKPVNDKTTVKLWKPEANRALDHYSQKQLTAAGFYPTCLQIPWMVFDLKSETNIWSFADLPGQSVPYKKAAAFIK